MSKSASQLKQFARRLLAHEASSSKSAAAHTPTAFRVCEKLRKPLGKLLGLGGFRALLLRAQALAGMEVPWLLALQLKADGSIEGLDELEKKFKSPAIAQGEIVLVAQLLALMTTFIGAELTLRLLHDIWPELAELKF